MLVGVYMRDVIPKYVKKSWSFLLPCAWFMLSLQKRLTEMALQGRYINFASKRIFVAEIAKFSVLFVSILALLFLSGCNDSKSAVWQYDLHGAWTLKERCFPAGYKVEYPSLDHFTELLVYDDSMVYLCTLQYLDSAFVVIPEEKATYSCTNKGKSQLNYFEGPYVRQNQFLNDSTIRIQRNGTCMTYIRAQGFVRAKEGEILDIVRHYDFTKRTRIMFSMEETELRKANHTLAYVLSAIIIIATAAILYAVSIRRRNTHLRQQLQQITKEREMRPEKVEKVLEEVKEDFLHSDYFLDIHRRIAVGEKLTDEDWQEMELQVNRAYPQFSRNLFDLVKMNDTEHKVCLLIKLQVRQKFIAATLYKTPNAISTIRARLYQKVFLKKGKAADWDVFILSL